MIAKLSSAGPPEQEMATAAKWPGGRRKPPQQKYGYISGWFWSVPCSEHARHIAWRQSCEFLLKGLFRVHKVQRLHILSQGLALGTGELAQHRVLVAGVPAIEVDEQVPRVQLGGVLAAMQNRLDAALVTLLLEWGHPEVRGCHRFPTQLRIEHNQDLLLVVSAQLAHVGLAERAGEGNVRRLVKARERTAKRRQQGRAQASTDGAGRSGSEVRRRQSQSEARSGLKRR